MLLEKTSYKRGDTSFAAQIARLKAANVDIVVLGTVVRETAAAALEARAQSWNVDMIVNGGLINAVLMLGGKAVEGLYGTTQFANSIDSSPGYRAFAHRFKTRFGRDVADGANYAYVSVMLFAEGARHAGPKLTPQTLAQGLEKIKKFESGFDTAPISYSAAYHGPPRAAIVLQVKDGKWT